MVVSSLMFGKSKDCSIVLFHLESCASTIQLCVSTLCVDAVRILLQKSL